MNEVRRARGLRALRVSAALTRAAVDHSRSMMLLGFFAHDVPAGETYTQRIRRYYPGKSVRSWGAGENLLWASPEISAREAVARWLGSPPHRANILRPGWRDVGVAALRAASARGVFASHSVVVVSVEFGTRT